MIKHFICKGWWRWQENKLYRFAQNQKNAEIEKCTYTMVFKYNLNRTLFSSLSQMVNELLQTKQNNSLLPSISFLASGAIKLFEYLVFLT